MDVLPSTHVPQSRLARRPMPRVAGALLVAGLVAVAAACSGDLPGNVVVGSGEPTTEVRQVADFVEVEASGGVALEVSTGAADGGAVIELGGLRATTAGVDLSGGVVATLAVTSSLTGTASGGVVISLEQRPDTVDVDTSGGAVVGP